jgi:hypothetical protein
MRPVRWLAWSVGVLFLVGTALQLVDTQNLYVTPPDTGAMDMVQQRLAGQDYRVAIWPIFFLSNLSFGIAFVAITGLGVALAAQLAVGDTRRVTIATSLGVAGVLGAVGQLILLGATRVTIDIAYCDCGFKETEIVSQIWAQMLADGASEALVDGASILAAIGILAVASAFRRDMPAAWGIWSWLTAIALIVGLVVRTFSLGTEDLGLILFAIISGVVVPLWAIWFGWSFRRSQPIDSTPAA